MPELKSSLQSFRVGIGDPILSLDDFQESRLHGNVEPCLFHRPHPAQSQVSTPILLQSNDGNAFIELIVYFPDQSSDLIEFFINFEKVDDRGFIGWSRVRCCWGR